MNRVVSVAVVGWLLLTWIPGVTATNAGEPVLSTLESWFGGASESVALFGKNLPPNSTCEIHALRGDGNACYTAYHDGLSAAMQTNSDGDLITRRTNYYDPLKMLWPCIHGNCSFQIPIASCDPPVARFRLICGGQTFDFDLTGPQSVMDPPSAALSLRVQNGSGPWQFDLVASLSRSDVDPIAQCTVLVEGGPEDGATALIEGAANAINASATCGDVDAELEAAKGPGLSPRLTLRTPSRTGAELIPGVHVDPGESNGLCFSLSDIGDETTSQARRMAVDWHTGPGGAMGGTVTVTEYSTVGACTVSFETFGDYSAAGLAQAVRDGFQTTGLPGPSGCPAYQNPRDVIVVGNRNEMAVATEIEVCVDDPGVGFTLRAAGIYSANPIARCQDVLTECTGVDGADVVLDGTASSDPNAPQGLPEDGLTFFWYENFGEPEQALIGQASRVFPRLPTGINEIGLVVLDAEGLVDQTTCTINVTDTQSPTISQTSVTPDTLYPPNHEMVDVSVYISAFDACGDTYVELKSITSTEPDDAPGPGDGATTFDIQDADLHTADFDIRLRAERDANGTGRAYELLYDVRDRFYNTQTVELIVHVPFDVEGAVDPIEVTVAKGASPGTALVDWTDHADNAEYDVVRGDIDRITPGNERTHMGPVDCLAVGTSARRVVDGDGIQPGEAKFYLVSAVSDLAATGFSNTSAVKPRYVTSCRVEPPLGGLQPDPERNSIVATPWGFLLGATGAVAADHLGRYTERLVDVDRIGPDLYQTVQVRNGGSTYGTPAYWFNGLTSSQVFVERFNLNGRILDVEPFVEGDQTLFTVSMIPNDGKRKKTWWWDYDLTGSEIAVAINANNMRLIDIEVYEKNGLTRFAYVGILNDGVDQLQSWPIYNATVEELGQAINDFGARLIDIEVRPDGNFSAVLVENDGRAWWWGAGLTVAEMSSFVENKGSRLVDVERLPVGEEWRYAFVSIDNLASEEARRLRPIVEQAFSGSIFGGDTRRGFLVKQVNGPVVAEMASGLSFNPASTLKLLPYLYAIQEVDRANASMAFSEVEWWGVPGNDVAVCVSPDEGVLGSAPFQDALPTLMWYSHNRTLDAFFALYPPYDPDTSVETVTSRAQIEWGMTDTKMFLGCPQGSGAPWMANRSTLHDIATLYEGVANDTFFGTVVGQKLFWRNMINAIQGNCVNFAPNTTGCSCPDYVDPSDCVGNVYNTPYAQFDFNGDGVADPIGPVSVSGMFGILLTIIDDEAPPTATAADIAGFKNQVIMRGKGGGWSGAEGMRSNSFYVSLPFKNGSGQIVPRNFFVAYFNNGWDGNCDGSLSCPALRRLEDNKLGNSQAELFREIVRQAWATW